jgi:hypothetical protein
VLSLKKEDRDVPPTSAEEPVVYVLVETVEGRKFYAPTLPSLWRGWYGSAEEVPPKNEAAPNG